MKAGTKVKYYLITDSRLTNDKDGIKHEIEHLFNDLLNQTEDFFSVEYLHAVTPELLQWQDGSEQYRMYFTLITKQKMSKNEIYRLTNKIQAHPLKFKQPC